MTDNRSVPTDLDTASLLADLVQYQAGAVVSRTVLKRPSGTVTAFAFDEGEGLSEHTAAFDALVILIEGTAEITVAGQPQRVAAGQVVRLPAGLPHALKALARFKMLLVMIRE
ncbi:MAG TPA: cupin domain-containing protein [Gemmatimonadaceae bacterium]